MIAFVAISLSSSAQSPFTTYRPAPSAGESNQSNTETTRVTGYIKNLSGEFSKVSLQVSFMTDSYGRESVTVVRMLEKKSDPFVTYGGNNWKTINAKAYYCNSNCDFTFYASYAGGYIYFDN